MHNPIISPAKLATDTLPATADVALCCPSCLDTLTPRGDCMNVGQCFAADTAASRGTRGATVKAPQAWTISGGVD